MPTPNVHCPACGQGYTVKEDLLGKKTKCKKCQTSFVLARTEERRRGEDGVFEVWEPNDTILDLYKVVSVLGEGGMGNVHRVRHLGWQTDLAVKSVRPDKLQSRVHLENFQREAEVWVNKLGLHPHVVNCFYVRVLGGLPRVFIDYVDGGTLKDWIVSRKLYEGGADKALERILDIAIQFAWGLDYAHERELVHQDVKPLNVMMTADGVAKVTDFGLAGAKTVASGTGDRGRPRCNARPSSENARAGCVTWTQSSWARNVWFPGGGRLRYPNAVAVSMPRFPCPRKIFPHTCLSSRIER